MRLRVLSIAFLLGTVSTCATWLLVQPLLLRMANAVNRTLAGGDPEREALARLWRLLPLYLALSLLMVGSFCYLVLYFMVERPLRRTEQTIEQLSRLDLDLPFGPGGGPLLSRVSSSLKRMADALAREQALTRRQVAALQGVNQQLSRVHTELAASERLATVGRLAAGIAHEVGNPLAGILGYLSLSKQRVAQNPELLDFLERIDHEVSRIDQIVRGLLDLGRPSQGQLSAVDVGKIVETCASLVSKGAEFNGIEVSILVEPETVAYADSAALSQVLINLMINAAQAINGPGKIEVQAARRAAKIEIEISDSGPGIPPDVLPHLFEPFFTTKAPGKGTGLGLAVSYHLVQSMGGELVAARGASGGAAFTIRLPST